MAERARKAPINIFPGPAYAHCEDTSQTSPSKGPLHAAQISNIFTWYCTFSAALNATKTPNLDELHRVLFSFSVASTHSSIRVPDQLVEGRVVHIWAPWHGISHTLSAPQPDVLPAILPLASSIPFALRMRWKAARAACERTPLFLSYTFKTFIARSCKSARCPGVQKFFHKERRLSITSSSSSSGASLLSPVPESTPSLALGYTSDSSLLNDGAVIRTMALDSTTANDSNSV